MAAHAPSMSYDNVVERGVSAPKSGEANFNDHGVWRGETRQSLKEGERNPIIGFKEWSPVVF